MKRFWLANRVGINCEVRSEVKKKITEKSEQFFGHKFWEKKVKVKVSDHFFGL